MRALSYAERLSVLTRQRPHVRCGGAGGAERGGVRLHESTGQPAVDLWNRISPLKTLWSLLEGNHLLKLKKAESHTYNLFVLTLTGFLFHRLKTELILNALLDPSIFYAAKTGPLKVSHNFLPDWQIIVK